MSKKAYGAVFVIAALGLAALALHVFTRPGAATRKARLTGRVVERGSRQPLKAEVGVSALTAGRLTFMHAEADERGEFSLDGVEAGQLHLSSKMDGYAVEHRSLTVTEGGDAAVEFELSRVKTVRGVVRDASGRPVPDADVRVVYPNEPLARGAVRSTYQWEAGDAQSDEAGKFEIAVHPEKEFVVEATHGSMLGAVSAPVRLRPAEAEATVNLSFARGASVSGVVTDEAGNALPGVQVRLVDATRNPAAARFASPELLRQGSQVTASDEHGAFSITRVSPAKKLILVKHPGYEMYRQPVEPAKLGKKTLGVVLRRAG